MNKRKLNLFVALTLLLPSVSVAQEPAAFKLKSTLIATYPHEHLLALRADTMGRLFVGARESLLVYEPKKNGGYESHRLLFRFPPSAWITDIELRGDDLYVSTQNALYLIANGVRKRADLVPRKIVWGVPVGAKDDGFRGLAWGPEGDLYFSLGAAGPKDRSAYWTFFTGANGAKVPYRGVGGVFRCKPDGGDLRVVAQGVRRPGRLAFDRYWNLFTLDHLDKTTHLWHVTPHAQLGPGIGKMDALPAMRDDAGREGPWYLDEAWLPKELGNQLLMGGLGQYWSYSLKPRGASYVAVEPFAFPPPPGSLAVGGARIFVIVSQSEIRELTDAEVAKPLAFEPYEASEAASARLWQELAELSWHRRYRAHIELLRRGGDLLKAANQRLLRAKADDPALHHLIWLAAKSEQGSLHLLARVDDVDPKVRAQTIRALTEFPEQRRGERIFTKPLLDEDPQVRLAAVSAFFELKGDLDRASKFALERGPARDQDAYLRQAAALLLARKATFKEIEAICGRADPSLRLAGVLAAGYRLTLPKANEPLAQQLPLGEIGHRVEYADGTVDLRELGRVGTFTIAAHWKADMRTVEQGLLFKLLRKMREDPDGVIRAQAGAFLANFD